MHHPTMTVVLRTIEITMKLYHSNNEDKKDNSFWQMQLIANKIALLATFQYTANCNFR